MSGRCARDCFALFSLGAIVQKWRGKIRLGFGLRGGAPVREFIVGFAICTLVMAGLFLGEWTLGSIRIEEVSPDVSGLVSMLGFFTKDAKGASEVELTLV